MKLVPILTTAGDNCAARPATDSGPFASAPAGTPKARTTLTTSALAKPVFMFVLTLAGLQESNSACFASSAPPRKVEAGDTSVTGLAIVGLLGGSEAAIGPEPLHSRWPGPLRFG